MGFIGEGLQAISKKIFDRLPYFPSRSHYPPLYFTLLHSTLFSPFLQVCDSEDDVQLTSQPAQCISRLNAVQITSLTLSLSMSNRYTYLLLSSISHTNSPCIKGPTEVRLTTPLRPIRKPASVLIVYAISAMRYS